MKTYDNEKLSKKYIANGASVCPICGSNNIIGEHGEFEAYSAWRSVACNDCNAEWVEEFGITGILLTEKY